MRKFLSKKYLIPVAVGIIVGLVLVAIDRNNNQDAGDDIEERVAGVSIQTTAAQSEVRVPVKFTGQIRGKQSTTIRALNEGVLQSLVPVGSKISAGSSLLRISNPSVEAAYQNALNALSTAQANLAQTQAGAVSAENQTQIAVSEATAALQLAKQAVSDAQTTGGLNIQKAADNARVTYDSAYNALENVMRYLGGANLSKYSFQDILNANQDVHTRAVNQFVVAKESFLKLNGLPGSDLEASLTLMEQAILEVDELNDLSVALLSFSVPGVGFDQIFLNAAEAEALRLQQALNSQDIQVKVSRNAIRDTKTQNEIALASANKQVEIAELRLQSANNVLASQAVSTLQQNLGASSQLSVANAQLAAARYQYNNLQAPSPFSGTVISHKASVGSQITFGQEILEVGDLNIIEIQLLVNAQDAKALRLGQDAVVNGQLGGRIVEIEPAADLDTGLVGVSIEADNADSRFASGSVVEVEFDLLYEVPNIIIVPLKLVQVGQNSQTLFVVEDGKASERRVELGQVFGPFVEIKTGLKAGEQIIVENQGFLDSGDPVNIE